MTTAKQFLIEHSGLQESTIDNSYKWVVAAMEAWQKQNTEATTPHPGEGRSKEDVLTEEQWCKLHTGYYGEEIDKPEQLVQTRLSGRELFEYCQHIVKHFESAPLNELGEQNLNISQQGEQC